MLKSNGKLVRGQLVRGYGCFKMPRLAASCWIMLVLHGHGLYHSQSHAQRKIDCIQHDIVQTRLDVIKDATAYAEGDNPNVWYEIN